MENLIENISNKPRPYNDEPEIHNLKEEKLFGEKWDWKYLFNLLNSEHLICLIT